MNAAAPARRAVLIVEDAETCASTLEIIFSSIRDLKILTSASAEQAWQLLESQAEDVRAIVTDLHMPGMDGFELIERVRADQQHAGLPIVVITGSTDPEVPERLRRRGVNAVFAKPYSPALVREKLEQLLSDDMQLG
jgi:two-component system, chemotaxis family, chemotaxis protein CheY